MKNIIKKIGIIAFVAVMGLGIFTSCEEAVTPTDITITGLSAYNGKLAAVGLSSDGNDVVALGGPENIAGGSAYFELYDENEDPISVEGSYYVILLIYNSVADITNRNPSYSGIILTKRTITATDNTFAFSSFVPVGN